MTVGTRPAGPADATLARPTFRPAEPALRPLPAWPLAALLLAFPLWWALGLGDFIFLLLTVPMALALVRRKAVLAPSGFGLWLCFLLTVLASALVLTAVAPGSASGGLGGRLLSYGYRLLWYLAATVVLLYVGNATERELPFRRLSGWLAVMFVVTVAGGLLGVLAPHLQFTSPTERLLPHSLASNRFVHNLIHPATADVEDVLGYPQARPRAPFDYANTWGASFSFFLPFFVYSWCRPSSGWRHWAAVPVLAAGAIGVIYSLNRGLWAVLVIGAVYGAIQLIRFRGRRALWVLAPALVVALLVTVGSPLSTVISDRFAHPHSDGRRSQLAVETVRSALTGSPVIGFGNIRDVQGSFASIAGGSTADCQGCGVPPLGTQGHAWMVIFSQGVTGLVLFFGFILVRLRRHLFSRHPMSIAGVAVLLFFLVETFVYDTLGSPIYTVMIAIGLMWRADREPAVTE